MESATFRLKPPKRKRRVYVSKQPPFPIPIQSITSDPACDSNWQYYTGYIVDNAVIVEHSGDMEQLFSMGFFGKGVLSRSQPEYNHGFQGIQSKRQERGLRFTPKRRYLTHLHWKKTALSGSSVLEDTEEFEFPHLPLPLKKPARTNKCETATASTLDLPTLMPHSSVHQAVSAPDLPTLTAHSSAHQAVSVSDPNAEKVFISKPHATVTEEEDPWEKCTQQESKDFWNTDSGQDMGPDPWGTDEKQSQECDVHQEPEAGNHTDNKESSESEGSNRAARTGEVCSSIDSTHNPPCTAPAERNEEDTGKEANNHKEVDSGKETERLLNETDSSLKRKRLEDDLDPHCGEDERDGDLFVVEDSDYSEAEELAETSRTKWQPVMKRDPAPVHEVLQLTLEEAYFLCYGLGCLVVKDLQDKEAVLPLVALWARFCSLDSSFVDKYIVYHHLRSKGWVPKAALKYGVHYVVYKEGPPFYHSSYSVLVRPTTSELHEHNDPLSLSMLAGINRVTETVNKEVMICYVVRPANITTQELLSPKCITRFKVQEVIVKRWISNQERENIEYAPIL